jgi:hypothetical protein
VNEEVTSLVQKIGSEVIRDCKNEELMRRLAVEAELTATEEIVDDLVDSIARCRRYTSR